MIFRNATFSSLPVSDVVKIGYWEWFFNIGTEILYEELRQDVMAMTTRDWLFAILIPLRLSLVHIAAMDSKRQAKRMNYKSTDNGYITYSQFRLYWRNWDDFSVTPTRYRRK